MSINSSEIRMFLWLHAHGPTLYGGMPENAAGVGLALLAMVIADEENCGFICATNRAWDMVQEAVGELEYYSEEPKYLCDDHRHSDRSIIRTWQAVSRHLLRILRVRYPESEPSQDELLKWREVSGRGQRHT